ncbi:(-)-germacrene D synthase [Olea europaea subsp. europaea]|uniref:(-)-germacrene D synthase n=1 Tax=Olea europaea subsp. europaea TaxID=158383 RepID=A0A8S0TZS2_OLEEU|nr:(-)-germacrene D synthase [Olea europaea subsp. europaea]
MDTKIHESAAPISTKHVGTEYARRSVTYHPSIWGDYFLGYTSDLTVISAHEEEELQRLKEEVNKLFTSTSDGSVHKLYLIDAIQRLGVGYHFENEIEKSLKYMYDTYHESYDKQEYDIYTIALRFRLLRQQGYYVSCEVFNKFKDQQGNFDESLISNAQGLLSLYEAAQFRVHGEEILEEALNFSTTHLNSVLHLHNHLSIQVSDAFEMPIHKTLTRLGAKKFALIYQEDESHNPMLLMFAKLDFNLLQKMHQKELCDITRWWKTLELENKFPFARDRLAECYFWILGVYFEPRYCLARRILTKVISLCSIIDDIYDVYGTIDEVTLFTDAIERWDLDATDQLPPYMKHCYKALLDFYVGIVEELEKTGKSSCAHYVKEEIKKVVRAYFQETKWAYDCYIPPIEEYMKVALVSCAYMMLSTASLVGMGDLATKEAFDWISSEPLIVRAAATICRLMDDMVGQGFEQKISVVECYINEKGVSKEEAFAVFQKQITNAWKDINQEFLQITAIPMAILMRVVNLASIMNLLYKDIDAYTHVEKLLLKDFINLVLVQPMTMP